MIFKPETGHVTILGSEGLPQLCNDLIRTDLSFSSVRQDLINTTMRTSAPDDGIDARVEGADDSYNGTWIPAKSSVWQYKSGKCPSANKLKKSEFCKIGVKRAIDDGESYCFVTSDDISAKKKTAIRNTINKLYRKKNKEPAGRVYTAEDLAQWVSSHPTIGVRYFNLPAHGWLIIDQIEAVTRFRNKYFADNQRRQLMEQIHNSVEKGVKHLRILGLAGVGKTRMVIESLKIEKYRNRVLYLSDAANFTVDFSWYLRNKPSHVGLILIIDECTSENVQRIKDLVENLPSPTTSILIGPLESTLATGATKLEGLDQSNLSLILESIAPEMPESTREVIASRCGGSPKFAVDLCDQILRRIGEEFTWEEIENNIDIVEYINARIYFLNAEDNDAKLMRGLSLFTRIGWEKDVQYEGIAISEFFGLDWREAREAAISLIDRGIASRRGRYFYPTPDILANIITRRTLQTCDRSQFLELLSKLSEDTQNSFADRIRQIGVSDDAKSLASDLMEEGFFFHSISDLNHSRVSNSLRLLTGAFPELAANKLESVILGAEEDELAKLKDGRRQVVWALEELVWWEDSFAKAARSLLRLAVFENEDYGNNATGVWQNMFQIMLGGSTTPFPKRLSLLKNALADADARVRSIAVGGLNSALKTQQIVGSIMPPTDTGRLPPEDWHPSTYREWAELIKELLPLLESAVKDQNYSVRAIALSVLKDRASDMINIGLAEEWISLVEGLRSEEFEIRAPFIDVIDWRLRHPVELENDDKVKLQRLRGILLQDSFDDRLRFATKDWHWSDRWQNENEFFRELDGIACELVGNPNKIREFINWLQSGRANSAIELGRRIGHKDEALELLPILEELNISPTDDFRFVCGYLEGILSFKGEDWLDDMIESWLDRWLEPNRVAEIIWRVLGTDKGAKRLTLLVSSGEIDAGELNMLVSGFWARKVSPEALNNLLQAMISISSSGSNSACLAVSSQYLQQYPQNLPAMSDLSWQIIENSSKEALLSMDLYHFSTLSKMVISSNPIRLAEYIIEMAKKDNFISISKDLGEVLDMTIKMAGWPVFEDLIGPSLVENVSLVFKIDSVFSGRTLLSKFPAKKICDWIAEDEKRLHVIAHAAPVGPGNLGELAVELLDRWGEADVGGALAATFGSGGWSGPESEWIRIRLGSLSEWAKEGSKEVKKWAKKMINAYKKQLDDALIHEEEVF
jgi:hypothetical protein